MHVLLVRLCVPMSMHRSQRRTVVCPPHHSSPYSLEEGSLTKPKSYWFFVVVVILRLAPNKLQ